jgi:D-threo-aldose 1-dehydrogenase
MDYHQLGNTEIKIPSIVFGTSALGNLFVELPYKTKHEIIRECINNIAGPIVLDSAGKYGAGLALEVLGENLEALGISNHDVIISNKLGWIAKPLKTPEPTFEPGAWIGLKNDAEQRISYEGILECWEQGNKLLGGRYKPKMVSVHDPDEYLAAAKDGLDWTNRFDNIVDAYHALAELKKEGKVKAIGVGAKNWKIIRALTTEVDLDWVMIANSMTIMKHPTDLLDFISELHRENIGIINSAVFHSGFLTGGNYFDYQPTNEDNQKNRSLFEYRKTFNLICEKFTITPAQACVAFGISPPGVISIALNTSDPRRVKENIKTVTTKVPAEFWHEMVKARLIEEDYPYLPAD